MDSKLTNPTSTKPSVAESYKDLYLALTIYIFNAESLYPDEMHDIKVLLNNWVVHTEHWDSKFFVSYPSELHDCWWGDVCLNCLTCGLAIDACNVRYHCFECKGLYKPHALSKYEIEKIASYLQIHPVWIEKLFVEIINDYGNKLQDRYRYGVAV